MTDNKNHNHENNTHDHEHAAVLDFGAAMRARDRRDLSFEIQVHRAVAAGRRAVGERRLGRRIHFERIGLLVSPRDDDEPEPEPTRRAIDPDLRRARALAAAISAASWGEPKPLRLGEAVAIAALIGAGVALFRRPQPEPAFEVEPLPNHFASFFRPSESLPQPRQIHDSEPIPKRREDGDLTWNGRALIQEQERRALAEIEEEEERDREELRRHLRRELLLTFGDGRSTNGASEAEMERVRSHKKPGQPRGARGQYTRRNPRT